MSCRVDYEATTPVNLLFGKHREDPGENSVTDQITDLLAMLDSDNPEARLTAIQVLGEIGDVTALTALRARMAPINKELTALVIAVGKLKRRLGVG